MPWHYNKRLLFKTSFSIPSVSSSICSYTYCTQNTNIYPVRVRIIYYCCVWCCMLCCVMQPPLPLVAPAPLLSGVVIYSVQYRVLYVWTKITVITAEREFFIGNKQQAKNKKLVRYCVQGPLCVNENNGYNGSRENFYRQQAKKWIIINDRRNRIPNKEEERRRKKKNNLLNLMNDVLKEPQEQDDYSTSSSEINDWLWASVEVHIQNSVEVHIQNSEWNDPKKERCMRGGILK